MYGVENGLSQSEVHCILQDSRGYLWVGTAGGGVCSFDGKKFHEYGKKDGLPGQMVSCIAEDSSGFMWFATNSGVARFDGTDFKVYNRAHGLGADQVNCIIALKDAVLLGEGDGVFEFSEKNSSLHRLVSIRNSTAFSCDNDGRVWIGTTDGLYSCKGGKIDSLPKDDRLKNISSLCCAHGAVYAGTANGLVIYDISTGKFTDDPLIQLVGDKQVSSICATADGGLWVGTLNNFAIKYYNEKKYDVYDRSNGLTADNVYMIIEDDSHHAWFATKEQSLLNLRSEAFTYFSTVPGMGSGTVFRIMEDHNGKMWIGSNADGLYCYDPATTGVTNSKPVLNNGKSFRQPLAVVEDKQNRIWIGHLDGVTCMVNGAPVKTFLNGIRVRSLLADNKGYIWVGTWGKGLYRLSPNDASGKSVLNFSSANNKLQQDYVHSLFEDKSGNIWIGTGGGLVKYGVGGDTAFFGAADGLCNTYVGSITADKWGKIWFHTDACIMRYDPLAPKGKNFQSYDESDGLASGTVYLAAFDSSGVLWVGTNKGIDRVVVDESGKFISVKNYSYNEGFRGIECNSRAVCLSHDGCLWFGTVKGVIRYDPSKDNSYDVPPHVHLTGICLFSEITDWTQKGFDESGWFRLPAALELPYDNNNLTFIYEGVHLHNPAIVRFKVILEGFDSTWLPVTSATERSYTNLPPGRYIFRVLSRSDGGEWNQQPASSAVITILPPPPPFWESIWFIGISAIAGCGLIYYLIVGRTKRIMRQKEQLEHEVRERTQEISRQNEEKTLLLKEIHHRVKNNLQVISSLLNLQAENISDKRVLTLFEDCRHRVNSMALIHEKMYQSKNLVNIDIRSYIDDLLRSLIDAYDSNKTIHLHTDIDDHPFRIDTIVPLGLILNEIISNSLKYAFGDRNEGDLFVTLHRKGSHRFLLEVADNGKGLPAEIDFEKADSLGMQLIRMLCGQVNGNVQLIRKEGTRYRITFEEEIKDRF